VTTDNIYAICSILKNLSKSETLSEADRNAVLECLDLASAEREKIEWTHYAPAENGTYWLLKMGGRTAGYRLPAMVWVNNDTPDGRRYLMDRYGCVTDIDGDELPAEMYICGPIFDPGWIQDDD